MTKFLPETSVETQPSAAPALAPETAGSSVGTSDAPAESAAARLLETAENAEQKRRGVERTWNSIGMTVMAAFALIICAMIANIYAALLPEKWIASCLPVLMVLNSAVQIGFRPLLESRQKRLQNAVAALLKFPGEPRLLLPLLDSLNTWQTPEWKSQTYPALTERLWDLSASEAALSLDDTRRATLRRFLFEAYPIMANGKRQTHDPHHFDGVTTDLAVAIMKTLAGIGDKKSVKVLQKIIKAEAKTPNEAVVRDAAREYLPALQQKITETEAVQRKLRVCLNEKIRDPQKVLAEYLDTFSPEAAKIALVNFGHVQTRRDFISRAICQAVVLVFVICAYFPLTLFVDIDKQPTLLGGGIGAAFGFLASVFVNEGKARRPSKAVQNVACELSRRVGDDTRFTGVLLSALQKGMAEPHAATVKKALVRLLPQLKPGDAALVPPAQRATLRSWLKRPRKQKKGRASHTMTIAALDALDALGDTRALPQAERLARRSQTDYRGGELQNAALRCAEALRARKTSG